MSVFERFLLNFLPPHIRAVVEAIYLAAATLGTQGPGAEARLPDVYWNLRGLKFRQKTKLVRLP